MRGLFIVPIRYWSCHPTTRDWMRVGMALMAAESITKNQIINPIGVRGSRQMECAREVGDI